MATTTTFDVARACGDLAAEAGDLLEDLIAALERVDAADLLDRARWPDELVALEALGATFDGRAIDLGCDLGAIQSVALARLADVQPDGRIVEFLLELLTGSVA